MANETDAVKQAEGPLLDQLNVLPFLLFQKRGVGAKVKAVVCGVQAVQCTR